MNVRCMLFLCLSFISMTSFCMDEDARKKDPKKVFVVKDAAGQESSFFNLRNLFRLGGAAAGATSSWSGINSYQSGTPLYMNWGLGLNVVNTAILGVCWWKTGDRRAAQNAFQKARSNYIDISLGIVPDTRGDSKEGGREGSSEGDRKAGIANMEESQLNEQAGRMYSIFSRAQRGAFDQEKFAGRSHEEQQINRRNRLVYMSFGLPLATRNEKQALDNAVVSPTVEKVLDVSKFFVVGSVGGAGSKLLKNGLSERAMQGSGFDSARR